MHYQDTRMKQPQDQDELGEKEIFGLETAITAKEIRNMDLEEDANAYQENLHMMELKKQCDKDAEYQELKKTIMDGFPDSKENLPMAMKKFWRIKEHLSVEDNFILYGYRLYIPENFRAVILSRMHAAHQGINRMQARAHLTFYWPKIDEDIEIFVKNCRLCQDNLPQNSKEPIIMKKRPEYAFQEIAMDFAETRGYNFLITVDCKTDWPDIFILNKKTDSLTLINKCKEIFRRTAIPNIVWSDNGLQFRSQKFQEFLKDWGILHLTRSPWYPQSNRKAEATVKLMKKIIQSSMKNSQIDEDKLLTALLQYRNTPNKRDGFSPAQKLFGHPIQDRMPMHKKSFNQGTNEKAERKANDHDYKAKAYYNRSAKELPGLKPGEHIALYNQSSSKWDTHGTILQRISKHRYTIKLESGSILQRNRKYLRPRNPLSVTRNEPREILRNTTDLRRSTRTKEESNRLIEN